jgi:phosphoglycolate phosphatase-like HAD superfamily hydrolase
VTPEQVEEYCRRFALLTLQGVIDAPWVPGVEEFLRNNLFHQSFVLVTATPQVEIEKILFSLNLRSCFIDVFGAPVSKKEAIHRTLAALQFIPHQCLMIGDAAADLDAARANQVPFLLRRHATNGKVFENFTGDSVENFDGIKFT